MIESAERGRRIQKLWRTFSTLENSINSDTAFTDSQLETLQTDILSWLSGFLSEFQAVFDEEGNLVSVLNGGYAMHDVTPYIHVLACHVVELMRRNDSMGLRKFSCQSLEKLNHQTQRNYRSSTNMHADATSQLLDKALRTNEFHLMAVDANVYTLDSKLIYCEMCGKEFKKPKNYRNHLDSVHPISRDPYELLLDDADDNNDGDNANEHSDVEGAE